MADKGFDKLSIEIDEFIKEDSKLRVIGGFAGHTITADKLEEFVTEWVKDNSLILNDPFLKTDYSELVFELLQFQVHSIADLKSIIPLNYSKIYKKHGYSTDVGGLIRDWMLIHDYKRYQHQVSYKWAGFYGEEKIFCKFLSDKEVCDIYKVFNSD